jgi:autotransporter passenger strand-loop-strand repeat protein
VLSWGTIVLAGGTADNLTLSSGSMALLVSGGSLTLSSGFTAPNVTVGSGGEVVFDGGTVKNLHVASGGIEGVGIAYGVSGLHVGKGITLTVSALAGATGTTVSNGGAEIVQSYGSATGTSVLSGGTIVFAGGAVSGLSLSSGATIDLATLAFGSAAKASFVENGAHTAGTLTVTDGALKRTVTLFGQYAAAGFSLSKDAAGGTDIHYAPVSAAHVALAVRQ